MVKFDIKDPKVIIQEDNMLLLELNKLMRKWNEIEGLKCKRRNESPNCDKPNMSLS